jgi:HD superfamily phosphodiesterase
MNLSINPIDEAKNYLKQYINENTKQFENINPWARDERHIVLHSFRVYSIAVEIIKKEIDILSKDDIILIELAAILHDIGKVHVNERHAEKSMEIVEAWLNSYDEVASTVPEKKKLLKIIKNHSNKEAKEQDICLAILKDADLLDEIGAMSIFMLSNRLDKGNPYFFDELRDKLNIKELPYCYRQINKLNTNAGKELLINKISFIKSFINELDYEIKGHQYY